MYERAWNPYSLIMDCYRLLSTPLKVHYVMVIQKRSMKFIQCHYNILVVPMTFGHPWLCHFNHPEHAVVSTDVRVSEPAVCTLRLSVRIFTPLFNVRKPKTPVLTFWTLVPENFENFRKHAPLYNRRFFR